MADLNGIQKEVKGFCPILDRGGDFEDFQRHFSNLLLIQSPCLLGFLLVEDYDGSQEFEYAGIMLPAQVVPRRGATDTHWSPATCLTLRIHTLSILIRHVSETLRGHVRDTNNVFAAWTNLVKHCGTATVRDFPKLYEDFVNLRMETYEDPSEFIRKFEKAHDKTVSLTKSVITPLQKALMLQVALPKTPEWMQNLAIWRGLESHIPYDVLRAHVIDARAATPPLSNDRSGQVSSFKMDATASGSAFNASHAGTATGRLSCAYCRIAGHSEDQCWRKTANEAQGLYFTPEQASTIYSRPVPGNTGQAKKAVRFDSNKRSNEDDTSSERRNRQRRRDTDRNGNRNGQSGGRNSQSGGRGGFGGRSNGKQRASNTTRQAVEAEETTEARTRSNLSASAQTEPQTSSSSFHVRRNYFPEDAARAPTPADQNNGSVFHASRSANLPLDESLKPPRGNRIMTLEDARAKADHYLRIAESIRWASGDSSMASSSYEPSMPNAPLLADPPTSARSSRLLAQSRSIKRNQRKKDARSQKSLAAVAELIHARNPPSPPVARTTEFSVARSHDPKESSPPPQQESGFTPKTAGFTDRTVSNCCTGHQIEPPAPDPFANETPDVAFRTLSHPNRTVIATPHTYIDHDVEDTSMNVLVDSNMPHSAKVISAARDALGSPSIDPDVLLEATTKAAHTKLMSHVAKAPPKSVEIAPKTTMMEHKKRQELVEVVHSTRNRDTSRSEAKSTDNGTVDLISPPNSPKSMVASPKDRSRFATEVAAIAEDSVVPLETMVGSVVENLVPIAHSTLPPSAAVVAASELSTDVSESDDRQLANDKENSTVNTLQSTKSLQSTDATRTDGKSISVEEPTVVQSTEPVVEPVTEPELVIITEKPKSKIPVPADKKAKKAVKKKSLTDIAVKKKTLNKGKMVKNPAHVEPDSSSDTNI